MLIWKNENILDENNEILLQEKYEENDYEKFIISIKIYLSDKRYIKIDGKPMIERSNSTSIPKLEEMISIWRKKSKELGIGDIYIISCLNKYNKYKINDLKLFDGAFKSPPYDISSSIIKNTRNNYIYYYGLFYSNVIDNKKIEKFPIYKGTVLEFDNSPINQKNPKIYGEYSPELFYLMNKILIQQIKENYSISNRFFFINAWNNYYEGTYLEPDEKFGYASINAFSRALFDLSYRTIYYNIENLSKACLVAVQAHIFYEDLTEEMITKINNIPVKFDLYITTTDNNKKEYIQNRVKNNLKVNNYYYEIKVVNNTKNDVFPFLIQMNEIFHKYKYFCHIHSKKTVYSTLGVSWRKYLFNNLLGDKDIISEILSDFENYEKLGVIFPQNFHKNIRPTMDWPPSLKEFKNYQNKLLNILFPGKSYKVTPNYYDFPAGTMFWARTNALYQLFESDKINEVFKNWFYSYVIERTLLFIAKINGYYYKKNFKYLN